MGKRKITQVWDEVKPMRSTTGNGDYTWKHMPPCRTYQLCLAAVRLLQQPSFVGYESQRGSWSRRMPKAGCYGPTVQLRAKAPLQPVTAAQNRHVEGGIRGPSRCVHPTLYRLPRSIDGKGTTRGKLEGQ